MKIQLKVQIKDITNNQITSFETTAKKSKNKIIYNIDNEKYQLYLETPNKLILNRETEEINSTLYFTKAKITTSIYHIKSNDIDLEINIKTDHIELSDKLITISYTVLDSDTKYEYKIEMSD